LLRHFRWCSQHRLRLHLLHSPELCVWIGFHCCCTPFCSVMAADWADNSAADKLAAGNSALENSFRFPPHGDKRPSRLSRNWYGCTHTGTASLSCFYQVEDNTSNWRYRYYTKGWNCTLKNCFNLIIKLFVSPDYLFIKMILVIILANYPVGVSSYRNRTGILNFYIYLLYNTCTVTPRDV
jgi:uncharacterized membrane protein